MKKLHVSYSELDEEKSACLASCLFNVDKLYFTDVHSSKHTALSLEAILNAIKSKPYQVNKFVAFYLNLLNFFLGKYIG